MEGVQIQIKKTVGVQIQIQNNNRTVFKSSSKKGKLKKGKEARKGEKRETKTGLKKPAGTGQKNGGKGDCRRRTEMPWQIIEIC